MRDFTGYKFFVNINGVAGVNEYWTVIRYDPEQGAWLCENPGYLRPTFFFASEILDGIPA